MREQSEPTTPPAEPTPTEPTPDGDDEGGS
jgi:hypothetical protein